MNDLERAVLDAASLTGGGPDLTVTIPEGATVTVDPNTETMLEGFTATWWDRPEGRDA